jgi:hypothetical protein
MADDKVRLAHVRLIRGDHWIEGGKAFQAAEWEQAEDDFLEQMQLRGYRIAGPIQKATEYDEANREVKIWISTMAYRVGRHATA